jgi:hypothetical protein
VASPPAGSLLLPTLSPCFSLSLLSLIRFWQGKERKKKNAEKEEEKEGKEEKIRKKNIRRKGRKRRRILDLQ